MIAALERHLQDTAAAAGSGLMAASAAQGLQFAAGAGVAASAYSALGANGSRFPVAGRGGGALWASTFSPPGGTRPPPPSVYQPPLYRPPSPPGGPASAAASDSPERAGPLRQQAGLEVIDTPLGTEAGRAAAADAPPSPPAQPGPRLTPPNGQAAAALLPPRPPRPPALPAGLPAGRSSLFRDVRPYGAASVSAAASGAGGWLPPNSLALSVLGDSSYVVDEVNELPKVLAHSHAVLQVGRMARTCTAGLMCVCTAFRTLRQSPFLSAFAALRLRCIRMVDELGFPTTAFPAGVLRAAGSDGAAPGTEQSVRLQRIGWKDAILLALPM